MKIVLSRKGFDSSSGGCPNPIFPDGTLLPLPIPDAHSSIHYRDIPFLDSNLGALVYQLTRGKIKGTQGAHLDPDIVGSSYPRKPGWRPLFGQMGAAQGHLTKEGVGAGDLFLFFSGFRRVERVKRKWRFVANSPAQHRIWGWFQIAGSYAVGKLPSEIKGWADYHPHCRYPNVKNNRLYLAADSINLGSGTSGKPGAGRFPSVESAGCLTEVDSRLPSYWKLPRWFYPAGGKRALTYHHNAGRWRQDGDACYLASVHRGQEFVLHGEDYPEAIQWAEELINSG